MIHGDLGVIQTLQMAKDAGHEHFIESGLHYVDAKDPSSLDGLYFRISLCDVQRDAICTMIPLEGYYDYQPEVAPGKYCVY